MALDVGNDFAMVSDGLCTVQVSRPDGTLVAEVEHALRRPLRDYSLAERDRWMSEGRAVWHLPAAAMPSELLAGDRITDPEGTVWTVLEVRRLALVGRWRCIAQNLEQLSGLDTTIDIEWASRAKTDSGATRVTWLVWKAGVPARIEPRESPTEVRHDSRAARRRFAIYVRGEFAPDENRRLRGPNGTVYEVQSCERVGPRGVLTRCDAQVVLNG
jgi:hypothetical protein